MKHNHQILFVTGKGGVGKTSISLMLGKAFAQNGDRTIIVQTYGAEQISAQFGLPCAGYTPQKLHTNLYTMSISAEKAIEEYALQHLKFRKLYEVIFENRFTKPLIQGAPGLHDAVHLGKIYDLAHREKWTRIIVDAPATGHALSMLQSAKTMMELTKSGPMYNSNAIVDAIFSDPMRTNIVLVSLLEELPVAETISLWNTLSPLQQKQCSLLVLNKTISPPPSLQIPELNPQWKQHAHILIQKYKEQQEQEKQIHTIPLSRISIPELISEEDKSLWEETLYHQIGQTEERES